MAQETPDPGGPGRPYAPGAGVDTPLFAAPAGFPMSSKPTYPRVLCLLDPMSALPRVRAHDPRSYVTFLSDMGTPALRSGSWRGGGGGCHVCADIRSGHAPFSTFSLTLPAARLVSTLVTFALLAAHHSHLKITNHTHLALPYIYSSLASFRCLVSSIYGQSLCQRWPAPRNPLCSRDSASSCQPEFLVCWLPS